MSSAPGPVDVSTLDPKFNPSRLDELCTQIRINKRQIALLKESNSVLEEEARELMEATGEAKVFGETWAMSYFGGGSYYREADLVKGLARYGIGVDVIHGLKAQKQGGWQVRERKTG